MVQFLDNFFNIHLETDVFLLILLGIANTMPIVSRHIFKEKFSTPIDFNKSFFDKRPILGTHKTWRGLFSSIIATAIATKLLGYGFILGAKIGFYSMLGDCVASFIKRRLSLKSGARFIGVDQGIEAFLPLIILKDEIGISWQDCLFVTFMFGIFEIIISPYLYKIGFRRNPY